MSFLGLNKISAQYADFGIGLGMTTYWGDLNAPSFTTNYFNNSGIAAHLTARIMKGERLGLRASYMYGRVNGNDNRSDADWQLRRNLSFKSYISEIAVMGELYILPFSTEPGRFFFAPYLTAGVSALWFNPTTEYQGQKVKLNPLGTEGQGMPGRPDKYSLKTFSIPFGGGAKFIFTENINLGVEVVVRRSFTDYLDDVSTTYVNYDDLSASNGVLAANLGNRMNEYLGIPEPAMVATGTQRGGASVNDYYIATMVTLHYVFKDSFGKKKIGGNKILCPTF